MIFFHKTWKADGFWFCYPIYINCTASCNQLHPNSSSSTRLGQTLTLRPVPFFIVHYRHSGWRSKDEYCMRLQNFSFYFLVFTPITPFTPGIEMHFGWWDWSQIELDHMQQGCQSTYNDCVGRNYNCRAQSDLNVDTGDTLIPGVNVIGFKSFLDTIWLRNAV